MSTLDRRRSRWQANIGRRTVVHVEQAIARGETDQQIAEHLSLRIEHVRHVRQVQDRINAEPDDEVRSRQSRRRPVELWSASS